MKKRILAGCLLMSLALGACSTSQGAQTLDLTQDLEAQVLEVPGEMSGEFSRAGQVTGLGLDLMRETFDGKNNLISPLSLASALGMVVNGADGQTLDQMVEVLGTDAQSLNAYLQAYRAYRPAEEGFKLQMANSIWIADKEDLKVEKDFLQASKDYYDASVFQTDFNRNASYKDINRWVKEQTGGMIEELYEQKLQGQPVMILLNALALDAEWEEPYMLDQVEEKTFTREDGQQETMDFMLSRELDYLENDLGQGFAKPYKDFHYLFVGFRPKPGLSMEDFLGQMDSDRLVQLLEEDRLENVEAFVELPKFSVESQHGLKEALMDLGMVQAFDENLADFTKLGRLDEGNIYMNDVLQKTKISVHEKGTQAGAATSVEMLESSAMSTEVRELSLDRPFFYMIVDQKENLPVFMGTFMGVEEK